MDRSNTSLYKDYRINIKSINDPNIINLGCEMRDTWNKIHRKLFKHLRKLFIPLCLDSHDGYYLNILRMITLCCHLYVEHEIYTMAYKQKISPLYDNIFIKIQWSSGVMMNFCKDRVR